MRYHEISDVLDNDSFLDIVWLTSPLTIPFCFLATLLQHNALLHFLGAFISGYLHPAVASTSQLENIQTWQRLFQATIFRRRYHNNNNVNNTGSYYTKYPTQYDNKHLPMTQIYHCRLWSMCYVRIIQMLLNAFLDILMRMLLLMREMNCD